MAVLEQPGTLCHRCSEPTMVPVDGGFYVCSSCGHSSFRKRTLFASYARADKAIVQPVVALLRVAGAHVFLDVDSIEPGDQWQLTISESIADSDVVLVFWTKAASESDYVRAEYEEACRLGKRLVPVMLDDTLMPEVLAQREGINLRTTALPLPLAEDPSSSGLFTASFKAPTHLATHMLRDALSSYAFYVSPELGTSTRYTPSQPLHGEDEFSLLLFSDSSEASRLDLAEIPFEIASPGLVRSPFELARSLPSRTIASRILRRLSDLFDKTEA